MVAANPGVLWARIVAMTTAIVLYVWSVRMVAAGRSNVRRMSTAHRLARTVMSKAETASAAPRRRAQYVTTTIFATVWRAATTAYAWPGRRHVPRVKYATKSITNAARVPWMPSAPTDSFATETSAATTAYAWSDRRRVRMTKAAVRIQKRVHHAAMMRTVMTGRSARV